MSIQGSSSSANSLVPLTNSNQSQSTRSDKYPVNRFFFAIFLPAAPFLFFLGYAVAFFSTPYHGITATAEIRIEQGEAFSSVARKLENAGVITQGELFSLWARIRNLDKQIHWGLYRFDRPVSPQDVLSGMVRGRTVFHKVTIPEGYTSDEIADLLVDKGLVRRERFAAELSNAELLARYGLEGKGLEGYLYPSTYYFRALSTEKEILTTLLDQFGAVFTADMMEQAERMDMTVHEVVTLASIIEKETGRAEERAVISGVFHNRLKRGMPLQSDPTVIYGLEDFNGNLTRAHLSTPTPYNTYTIAGLPPGPIANPGLGSMLAALYPAKVPYLYFVSKNDGSHFFSKTIREHNRAVRKYQLSRSSP